MGGTGVQSFLGKIAPPNERLEFFFQSFFAFGVETPVPVLYKILQAIGVIALTFLIRDIEEDL